MKKTTAAVLVAVLAIVLGSTAVATMDMQKDTNAKYPTAKAKCASCHVKAMAKKGDAELNAFGKDMMKFVVDPKAEKKTFDWAKLEPSTATATARRTPTSSRPARTPARSRRGATDAIPGGPSPSGPGPRRARGGQREARRSSCRSWSRERSACAASAPQSARNMSHCVSHTSPCVPRNAVAASPVASAAAHSISS